MVDKETVDIVMATGSLKDELKVLRELGKLFIAGKIGYVLDEKEIEKIKDILAQPIDRISSISIKGYGEIRQRILDILNNVGKIQGKEEIEK